MIVGLQETVALAAIAVVGYLFGRKTSSSRERMFRRQREAELDRASRVAYQLEGMASSLRRGLADHHALVTEFQRRLASVRDTNDSAAWESLNDQTEEIAGPTLQLAKELSKAYDKIRKQSQALIKFSAERIDPVTGVGNARALQQQIQLHLAEFSKRSTPFSAVVVAVEPAKGGLGKATDQQNRRTQLLADVLLDTASDADFVARHGTHEFVVLLRRTGMNGARNFCRQLETHAMERLGERTCAGLTEVKAGDGAADLLSRAEAGLYAAKAKLLNSTTQITVSAEFSQQLGSAKKRETCLHG